jgi:hypothetical protein
MLRIALGRFVCCYRDDVSGPLTGHNVEQSQRDLDALVQHRTSQLQAGLIVHRKRPLH